MHGGWVRMKCKKCQEEELQHQTIVKYGDGGNHKVVGNELFCPNMNCDVQFDVKKEVLIK